MRRDDNSYPQLQFFDVSFLARPEKSKPPPDGAAAARGAAAAPAGLAGFEPGLAAVQHKHLSSLSSLDAMQSLQEVDEIVNRISLFVKRI